ncbi:F-box/LRR-repeat protein At3g59250-like [Salvia miltiorrhiza]|uniref:F-box/LRR-repeat protein At3g59250-like n=1 Tax=Salvia miltiorrhiza TaxID=226208 RepID=UPI0025AD4B66|nr:F-box/LRR-repeat protein At3g59250-like [Salvia miltiorrhiza]
MEKCKRIQIRLPEAIIQQIQSFLSEEEAARTTLISKSWYNAWQTRPVLVLRNLDWRSSAAEFSEFAVKTMRRLIVDAMKLGATDLNLEFKPTTFVLPAEVLGSESLLRLSVFGCEIDGNFKCSMLKSLSLDLVLLKSDDMLGIITSCCKSIEELSLSNSKASLSNPRRTLSSMNLHELHKLKRLYLEELNVDYCFFYDLLESRFPCLDDMSLVGCFFWLNGMKP